MKTKKNTIRLTENELKNIITESVKNIISELDWKTYANAARKASQQAGTRYDKGNDKERSYRFANAASDAFNKEFGYGYYASPHRGDGSRGPRGNAEIYSDIEQTYRGPRIRLNQTKNTTSSLGLHGYKDYEDGEFDSTDLHDNNELEMRWDAANAEMENYRMGRYDYTKGKGWHLRDE